MNKNLFSSEGNSLLLIIDVQEKLVQNILNKSNLIKNINKLIEVASLLKIDVIYSEQNPSKLGKSLVNKSQYISSSVYEKMCFNCLDNSKLYHALEKSKKKRIVVCGLESHICIKQTCLSLENEGYEPYLIVDAISSRNLIDHETAIASLLANKISIGTTESIIFEWCKTADRDEFRKISSIIKSN